MNEKISVIVPVYNAGDYLKQCLDSILQQTYTNLEILLINDGSTDDSAQICEEYKAKDSRIRVYHKENGGVSSSRNISLELVSGTYLLFVDCDDWLYENHVEKLYHLLKKTDSDIAIGNFTEFHEDSSNFLFYLTPTDYFEQTYTPFEWFDNQYRSEFCLSQCFTVPWAKLYKRSLFDNISYPMDKKVEDDFTTYKIYLLADKIAFMNEPIYYHRKRNTSITRKVNASHVYPLKSIEE